MTLPLCLILIKISFNFSKISRFALDRSNDGSIVWWAYLREVIKAILKPLGLWLVQSKPVPYLIREPTPKARARPLLRDKVCFYASSLTLMII